MNLKSVVLVMLPTVFLTGCALSHFQSPADQQSADRLQGSIYGGQQPISGSTVTLYAAGTSGYGSGASALVQTTSSAYGSFTLPSYTCPYANTPVFVTAQGGDAGTGTNDSIMLIAGLGNCGDLTSETFVNINEITTAATAFALSHFFTLTLGSGSDDAVGGTAVGSGVYNEGLSLANQATIPTLVNLASGLPNLTNTVGSVTKTFESDKLNSIANVLAACVNSGGATSFSETETSCGQLFAATTPPNATVRPSDTLQAAVQMALYPYQNVNTLFNLQPPVSPFVGLSEAPNDWTLAVSYSTTDFGLGIDGSSTASTSTNLDIDVAGNVWFPTNALTSHGIGQFNPYTGSFTGPFLTGLIHPQYLAITEQGLIYASDTAGAQIAATSTVDPSANGTTYTANGFTGPIQAAYSNSGADAIVYTGGGSFNTLGNTLYQNVNGTNQPVLTYAGIPANIISYGIGQQDVDAATSGANACRYESDTTGTLSTQALSNLSPCFAGGVANDANSEDGVVTLSSTNELCNYGYGGTGSCFMPPIKLFYPEAIESDGDDNLWVANAGNNSVSTLVDVPASNGSSYTSADYQQTSTVPYLHPQTMPKPYGLAVDRSGNVWISNAGCVSSDGFRCSPGPFVLSELIGAAAPTITPLANIEINNGMNTRPNSNEHQSTGSKISHLGTIRRGRSN